MRRTIMLLASMAVVLVLASGAAFAALTISSGGPIQQVVVARETEASTSSSKVFVSIPGASVGVFVPSGTSRLIMARYSAESACSGVSGYCSVKIVARNNSTGANTDLNPASGSDFAFDSTDAGRETSASWESHSMDRSIRLGPGSYTISVQRLVTNGVVEFRLDDWSFTVEQSQ